MYGRLMDLFLDYKFGQRFSNVNYHFDFEMKSEHSILVIGNHTTWWDGFIVWQLNRTLLKKEFYLVMLEKQLSRFWFFRKIGCFSINPGSRDVVESLQYGAALLKNPGNMLVFYPQGKLHSSYENKFTFNKGVEYLVKNNPQTAILFYALFIEYGSNEKPYINLFFHRIEGPDRYTYLQLQETYSGFYEQSKISHIQLITNN